MTGDPGYRVPGKTEYAAFKAAHNCEVLWGPPVVRELRWPAAPFLPPTT